MCNNLFPEYEKIWFHSLRPTSVTGYLKTNKTPDCDFAIHWFEFCMTHLLDSIAFSLVKSDILADMEYETYRQAYIIEIMSDKTKENYINPIDYLYSQFKLIKTI